MTTQEMEKQRYDEILSKDDNYYSKYHFLDPFEHILKLVDGVPIVLAWIFFKEREIAVNPRCATEQDYKNLKETFKGYIFSEADRGKPYVDLSGQPNEFARRQREIPI